jgi:hypothetical protein
VLVGHDHLTADCSFAKASSAGSVSRMPACSFATWASGQ